MMVFKGYHFNIFIMYKAPLKNALFNTTVMAGIRSEVLSGGVWVMLRLWEQGNWKGALRQK